MTARTTIAGMDKLAEMRGREEEVGREWEWLNDAINKVARAKPDGGR